MQVSDFNNIFTYLLNLFVRLWNYLIEYFPAILALVVLSVIIYVLESMKNGDSADSDRNPGIKF